MTEQEALIGRVVDERYRVVEPLGEGGMGLVFRAEHLKLQRPVALKVLQQEFVADQDLRERFEREARALAALAHPNIVTITDYGVLDGQTPYLVMELLEGETLHQRLHDGALPPERAAGIARQMLRALAHAHRQGIVHRDLKPGNIFLTPLRDDTDHAKILDFGLVRFLDAADRPDEKHLTRAGSILGTPAYMAPEQVAGEPTDARTDVYAAGVVIFEIFAGRKPFVGEPADILRHHLLTPPPALTEVHPGLEGAGPLDALLARALAKEKRLRFADATEMLAALEEVPIPTLSTTAARPVVPAELGTMPTMHASDAAKPRAPATAVTMATPVRPASAAPTPPPPSSTLHLRPEALTRLKRTALAVGGGLAIAAMIITLVLLAAHGGEEPAVPAPEAQPTNAPPRPDAPRATAEAPSSATSAGSRTPAAAAAPAPTDTTPAAPAAASAGRPAAVNPWAAGTPRELARAKRAVESGNRVGTNHDRAILRYAQLHADDPRPHLLLAHAFLSRGWRSDAVERYELAARKSSAARGDPRMLEDLVALSALEDRTANAAARAVRGIYGAEALPEIDRQLATTRDRAARSRLARLKQSLETAPR